MSTQTQIADDAVIIDANIPECRKVEGLEHGAHVSQIGWCGKYVRIPGTTQWGVARLTPASDELPGDGTDAEIVEAVSEAIAAAVELRNQQRDDAIDAERRAWKWARGNQGFSGDFAAWQSLSYRERMEYEAGAAGDQTR